MATRAPNEIAVGIDFGTSACRVATALADAGRSRKGEVALPVLVTEDDDGRLLVGPGTSAKLEAQPELGVMSVKRLLGRWVGSPEIEWVAATTPQLLAQTTHGIAAQIGENLHTAHAMAQEVFARAVSATTDVLQGTRAVLAIPAMFDMPQRLALRQAAGHAGLDVVRMVEAPVAALLAMDLPRGARRVMVIDWGAGYFDVSLAEQTEDGWSVLGADGDTLLGTDDLDHRIVDVFVESFFGLHQVDLSSSGSALARLRRRARRVRLEMCKGQSTATVLPDVGRLPLVHPPLGPAELEELWAAELEAIVPPCLRLFQDLGLGTDDVDALVLLGGACRIPVVRTRIERLVRHRAIVPNDAMLAARGAASLSSRSDAVRSVLPHTLSLREGHRPPVPVTVRNQPLPISSTHFFKPTSTEPVDVWLCQGEEEHDYDAFRVARAHVDHTRSGSYLVEIELPVSGDVAFHIAHASELGMDRDEPAQPSSIPPSSDPSTQIVVNVDGLDEAQLDASVSIGSDGEDEVLGGPPTIQVRRKEVGTTEADTSPAPSSRPERVARRSLFGRGHVADVVAHAALPTSKRPTPTSERSAEDPLVGQVLSDRYEVTGILGEGSMARVYTASHKILKNKYAVKVMHPALAADEKLRERFLREARAAAAIDSDHVVRILDFGRAADDRDYFVMEYLEGSSLESEIQARLLPIPLVMTIMIHVARGLEAAHAHDIVHRDLKPENVWLTKVGANIRVKILDFGVAKIPTSEAGLTMGNSIIGTPYYMAPEQVSGKVDHRTDIYAAGIMMFELVTGRLPFHHESLALVLAMQCDKELPSPRALAGPARCSEALERLIRRCTAKKKEDRLASAAELRAALEGLRA